MRIHPALAFGIGVLSFAGWLASLALDAKVFYHNPLGSFFAHLPLMLIPAALVLAFPQPPSTCQAMNCTESAKGVGKTATSLPISPSQRRMAAAASGSVADAILRPSGP